MRLLILVVSAILSLFTRQALASDRTVLGILRPDGGIVPFALFDGSVFSNPWSKPEGYGPRDPNTVAELERPWFSPFTSPSDKWLAWLPEGPQVLKAKSQKQMEAHCSLVWGLPTEKVVRRLPNKVYEPTKLAVVTNRPLEVLAFADVATDSKEAKRFVDLIKPVFDQNEAKDAKNAGKGDFQALELRKVNYGTAPIKITSLKSVALNRAESLYFLQARREYDKARLSEDRGCEIVTYQNAWFRGQKLIKSEYVTSDCDMQNVPQGEPFAVIRGDNKTYVIHENIGYEGESYSILSLTPAGLQEVLETYGGGC